MVALNINKFTQGMVAGFRKTIVLSVIMVMGVADLSGLNIAVPAPIMPLILYIVFGVGFGMRFNLLSCNDAEAHLAI